jgi:hypothetical protein
MCQNLIPALKHQVKDLSFVSPFHFESSGLISKQHHVSFLSRVPSQVANPFELVHSSVWGPLQVTSNKFKYFFHICG